MIARLDSKKETIEENVSKIKKLESRYSAYKYFIEAVQRDGVPYELISDILPFVEEDTAKKLIAPESDSIVTNSKPSIS